MWQPIIEVSTCPIEWRIHGLIGDGSDAPNVVQAYAERSILQTAKGYFRKRRKGFNRAYSPLSIADKPTVRSMMSACSCARSEVVYTDSLPCVSRSTAMSSASCRGNVLPT